MRFSLIRSLLLGSAAVTALLGAEQVSAQQITLEEIVVTARARTESLQDIPLAITAFTAADMENAGMQDLSDLALQTAGMQFFSRRSGFRAGRVDSVINLRGVSSGTGLDHLQPTSLFVDGIFVLGTASSIGLQDLERVEVIKGPQSAFFGRNTFAGAINFITKNPSLTEYETKIDVSAATYDKFDFNVLTSIPLIEDKLAIQINGRLYSRGGEWTATDGGQLGQESSSFISATVYGEPNERSSFKLRAYYQRDDDGSPVSGVLSGDEFDSCSGTTVSRFNAAGTAQESFSPFRMACGDVPTFKSGLISLSRETSLRPTNMSLDRIGLVQSTGALLFGPQPDALREFLIDDKFVKSVPNIDKMGLIRDQIRLSANADYEFSGALEGYTFSFLGGYNDMGLNFLRDYDQSDFQAWYSTDPKFGRDWSVEARLTSPQDKRLRGLLGVSYVDQEFITSGSGGLLVLSCFNFTGAPAAGTPFSTACGGGPGIFTLPATSGNVAKVKGVFASLSFDITETLTFDAEARYSEDERTAGEAGFFNQITYKDWVPRFILNYQPTDDTTIYIQASRGILPGATNGLLTTCSEDDFLVAYTSPITGQQSTASECDQFRSQLQGDQFAPSTPSQVLDAAEIGWKQQLMDGRARFNLTAWHYEWKNRPYGLVTSFVRDAEDPAQRDRLPNNFANSLTVQVGGSSKFWGVEFESGMAFTEQWDAQLNVSWQDNKITDLLSRSSIQTNGGFINLKGLKTLRFPGIMWNASTTYTDALNSTWDYYGRADVSYSGEYWADVDNLARGPDWFVTNVRVGLQREDLRIELFVRNLFQETAWQTVSQGAHFKHHSFNFGGFRGLNVSPQEKRTFGVRTNLTF
ncbi:MAG: TonB-dependent receptor [Rhodospirillaceae bacterium]|nr:TonB-dependent receptor [Rhodospirillaceae bacterium]